MDFTNIKQTQYVCYNPYYPYACSLWFFLLRFSGSAEGATTAADLCSGHWRSPRSGGRYPAGELTKGSEWIWPFKKMPTLGDHRFCYMFPKFLSIIGFCGYPVLLTHSQFVFLVPASGIAKKMGVQPQLGVLFLYEYFQFPRPQKKAPQPYDLVKTISRTVAFAGHW